MGSSGPVSSQINEIDSDKIALRQGHASLTYAELNRRADLLAAHLINTGLRPFATVAICLERSFDWVIAALAVMRAGAAYVPMDDAWPDERVSFAVVDSDAKHLIAHADRLRRLDLDVEGIDPKKDAFIASQAGPPTRPKVSPDDLAYIIYTSGTSGYPKGVEVTHSNLSHLVDWHCDAFGVTSHDRASHLAGLSFDAAGWEIWPYLARGASISLVDEITRTSPELLQQWLLAEQITISYVPTALALPLTQLDWPNETPLRFVLTGGERLHRAPARPLPFVLVNNYGPTECTVVSTSGVVECGSSSVPSIGRPIGRTRIYLLDKDGTAVPQGAVGEICIGGPGVGRGYRNLPGLTAGSFLPDPFSSRPNARMYRTGDLGALLPNGQIEFRGRVDSQEKIRGNRVEVEEISSVLYRHLKVRFATVHALADRSGEKRLVAYVMPISGETLTSSELQQFLSSTLPSYMLPVSFVRLNTIPLSRNGKIDKSALPTPSADNLLPAAASREPESNVDRTLLAIIRKLLESEAVGMEDDFFLAGGHSLLGTQLILQIRAAFQVDISLRDLFEARTVQQLAKKIETLLIAEVNAMTDEEAMRQMEASI